MARKNFVDGIKASIEQETILDKKIKELQQSNSKLFIDPNLLVPSIYQPRLYRHPDAQEELKENIAKFGILTPLLVQWKGEAYRFSHDNPNEIIVDHPLPVLGGESRRLCALELGILVPVYLLEVDDDEAQQIALIDNLKRSDLTILEETLAASKILIRFLQKRGYEISDNDFVSLRSFLISHRNRQYRNPEKIDKTLTNDIESLIKYNTKGKSWGYWSDSILPIIYYPEDIQQSILTSKINLKTAELLVKVEDKEERNTFVQMITREDLSYKDLKQIISNQEKKSVLPTPRSDSQKKPFAGYISRIKSKINKNNLKQEQKTRIEELFEEILKIIEPPPG